MSEQTKLRVAGFLILAAFPLYGGGQVLMATPNWPLGLALTLANSVGVIGIGALMRSVMVATAPGAALTYLIARIGEGVLLAMGALTLVSTSFGWGLNGADFYHLGMTALGLGSLPMCLWLVATGRVARPIGWLGFAGYLCLVFAMVAADRGFDAVSAGLLIPGAVFELIFGGLLVMGRVAVAKSRVA